MQLPYRKAGKYTNKKTDPYLTEAKYLELKNKLERLLKSRPQIIEEVKRLASDGDFSENAAYQIAKGRLRGLNQGILETEDLLKKAIIIKPKNLGQVSIGSQVTVETNNKTLSFLILGSAETKPAAGIISRLSPLGAALIGHRVGETIKVRLADRVVTYKILKIE